MKLSFYHIKLFAIFYLFLFNINVYAQSDFYENDTERGIRVMFYNVENLFDPHNDSLKLDDEYTPTGIKHWTYSRFNNKLNNIYKVIVAVGEWTPPEIIGLAEIENYNVL